jgi:predicted phage tail component-like protein
MPSIVKVPTNTNADYDFIAFSFNGKHSYEDMGIYRTSDGNDGYSMSLTPEIQDKTANSEMDGSYFFKANHKSKVFNIKFAFDSLTEKQFNDLKIWLNGKEQGDLWFAEEPYKVYTAKVTGSATITTTPFTGATNNQKIYKGTGSVTFTCYWPYAHTPDYVEKTVEGTAIIVDGRTHGAYEDFKTLNPNLLPGKPGGFYPYG